MMPHPSGPSHESADRSEGPTTGQGGAQKDFTALKNCIKSYCMSSKQV